MTQKTAGPKNLHCSMKFLRLLPCYCFNYFQRSPTIKAAFCLKCVIHKHVGFEGVVGVKVPKWLCTTGHILPEKRIFLGSENILLFDEK